MRIPVIDSGSGPELVFPENFNVASALIDCHLLEGRGEKNAILAIDETVSYATLAQNVNRYGNAIAALGVNPGDRVLLLIKDAPEFYYAFWGCIKAGIIPVPLNTMLTAADYRFIINDSGATAVLYSAEFSEGVEAAIEGAARLRNVCLVRHGKGSLHELAAMASPALEPWPATKDTECFWLYSSGTTGKPKGVVHVHADIVATCELYSARVLGASESDIYYSIPRLFFAYGLGCGMTFPLYLEATAVLDSRRPTPQIAADLIKRFGVTIFASVPTFLTAFLAAGVVTPSHLASLRRCISGGEALPDELQRRWREVASVPITDGIGSTETLHIYLSNTVDDVRPNSSGRAVPGYDARILDDGGVEIEDGRPGRLWIKGPSVTRRYWNNPEKTAASIVDGWLDTGDTYRRDEEGYYYYCGRNDDMLKVGGIWVSPFEIEATLMSHPDVVEVAVVGRADEAGLVKPEAWVVLRNSDRCDESTIGELRDYCKRNMAPYKYPRWIHCVETLPKTATGKIQRFKLRLMSVNPEDESAAIGSAAATVERT